MVKAYTHRTDTRMFKVIMTRDLDAEYYLTFNNKDLIGAVFLDFSTAIDNVDHLNKLRRVSLDNNLINWCQSFLFNRSQQVMVERKISTFKPVLSGDHGWTLK